MVKDASGEHVLLVNEALCVLVVGVLESAVRVGNGRAIAKDLICNRVVTARFGVLPLGGA